MSSDRTAMFPGTFDPFTNGHLDLTRRAARMFGRVVIAVAESPAKGTLFPIPERVEMIRAATKSMKRVDVVEFSDLVVECARRMEAEVIIRGLRAVSDFEFEFQMALMNRKLSPALEIAFLMPSLQYTYLNSTLVKEVARLGGSVKGLVPDVVEERLRQKLGLVAPKRRAAGTEAEESKPSRRKAAMAEAEMPEDEVAEDEVAESEATESEVTKSKPSRRKSAVAEDEAAESEVTKSKPSRRKPAVAEDEAAESQASSRKAAAPGRKAPKRRVAAGTAPAPAGNGARARAAGPKTTRTPARPAAKARRR